VWPYCYCSSLEKLRFCIAYLNWIGHCACRAVNEGRRVKGENCLPLRTLINVYTLPRGTVSRYSDDRLQQTSAMATLAQSTAVHCFRGKAFSYSHKPLKLDRTFYPPSVNSAFYFIAVLLTHRSANRTQPNFAKR